MLSLLLKAPRTGSGWGHLLYQRSHDALSRSLRSTLCVFLLGLLVWSVVVSSSSSDAVSISDPTPYTAEEPNTPPHTAQNIGDSQESDPESPGKPGDRDSGVTPGTAQSAEAMPRSDGTAKHTSENVPDDDDEEAGEPAKRRDLDPEAEMSARETPSTSSVFSSANTQADTQSREEAMQGETSHHDVMSSDRFSEANGTNDTHQAHENHTELATEAERTQTIPQSSLSQTPVSAGMPTEHDRTEVEEKHESKTPLSEALPEPLDALGSHLSAGNNTNMMTRLQSEGTPDSLPIASSLETPAYPGTSIDGDASQKSSEMSMTHQSDMSDSPEIKVETGSAAAAEQTPGTITRYGSIDAVTGSEEGLSAGESEAAETDSLPGSLPEPETTHAAHTTVPVVADTSASAADTEGGDDARDHQDRVFSAQQVRNSTEPAMETIVIPEQEAFVSPPPNRGTSTEVKNAGSEQQAGDDRQHAQADPDAAPRIPGSDHVRLEMDAKGNDGQHGDKVTAGEEALASEDETGTMTPSQPHQSVSGQDAGKNTEENETSASPAHVAVEVGSAEGSENPLFATEHDHLQHPAPEENSATEKPTLSPANSTDIQEQNEESKTDATEQVYAHSSMQVQPETEGVAPFSPSTAPQRAAEDPERSDGPLFGVHETETDAHSHHESTTAADSPLSGPLTDLFVPTENSETEEHEHPEEHIAYTGTAGVDEAEKAEPSFHHGVDVASDDHLPSWVENDEETHRFNPDDEYSSGYGVGEYEQDGDTFFSFHPAHEQFDLPQSGDDSSFVETHEYDGRFQEMPIASRHRASEASPPLQTPRPASFSFFGRVSPSSQTKKNEVMPSYYDSHQSHEKAFETAHKPSPIINAYRRFGGRHFDEMNAPGEAVADEEDTVLVGLQSSQRHEQEKTQVEDDNQRENSEVSSPRRRAEPEDHEHEETAGSGDHPEQSQQEPGSPSPSLKDATTHAVTPSSPSSSPTFTEGVASDRGESLSPDAGANNVEAPASADSLPQEKTQEAEEDGDHPSAAGQQVAPTPSAAGQQVAPTPSAAGQQVSPTPSAADSSAANEAINGGSVSDPREGKCSREELEALTEYFSGQSDTCSAYRCIEVEGMEFHERLKEHYGSVYDEAQLEELAGLFAACYCRCPMMKCEVDYVMERGSDACKEATVEYCEQSNEKFVDRCTSAAEQLPLVYDLSADTGGFKLPCRVCRREDLDQPGVSTGSVHHSASSAPSDVRPSTSSENTLPPSGGSVDLDRRHGRAPSPTYGRETGNETGISSGASAGQPSTHPTGSGNPSEADESGRNDEHEEHEAGSNGTGWGRPFSPDTPTSQSESSRPPSFSREEDKEAGYPGGSSQVSTMPSSQGGAEGASEDLSPLLGGETAAGATMHGPGEVLSPSESSQASESTAVTTVRPTTTGSVSATGSAHAEEGEAGGEAVEALNEAGADAMASSILLALGGSLLGILVTRVA
ncbi:hypothetical protein TGP89_228240 [Toxoplasma gondii p89]|uniref:Uncharacterized protein n=1 Tax=Toxoplasma gondii p89 TaxID=943119 RepID=A0A086KCR3_TOXGO|nr:hypothetical protein TGP89_228240 [Toxoplasma gondii p89]